MDFFSKKGEEYSEKFVLASNSPQWLEARDLPSVRILGRGVSGIICETTWKGKKYARKDFPLGSEEHNRLFESEVESLFNLNHPNSCSLLQEYVDDSLEDIIQRRVEEQEKKATSTIGNMFKLWRQSESSSSARASARVNFLKLCQDNVHTVQSLSKVGNLLNQRQCQDLSTKLSITIQNVQELVSLCGAPSFVLFRPALENLCQYLERAKVLVSKCGEEDWLAESVFQSQNEHAFREILLQVGLCYNAIYELATSCSLEQRSDHPKDLRQPSIFLPAVGCDVIDDQRDLQNRLEYKVNDQFEAGRKARKAHCLAGYLLLKLNSTPEQSGQSQTNNFDGCSAIFWRKETQPSRTWGHAKFLGSGSGGSGVCSTKWLGIPCAKKEFHGQETETVFLKETSILAGLKHPHIVNFICCGNGKKRGDRFIGMELMEKSLLDLIEDQKKKNEQFPLPAVIDMIVQMALGMLYLHDQGVAHRDLKPQNVVVKRLKSRHFVNHFVVKLVDFGISKANVVDSRSITLTALGIGTTRYRAPEVHPKAHPHGKGKVKWFKADVYSFAITCAHVLSLETPFGYMEQLGEIFYNELLNGRRPWLPDNCPPELISLLSDCWNTNPHSRPSFMNICTRLEIFRHKILRGFSTQDFQKENMDCSTGFGFVKTMMEQQFSVNKDESVDKTDSKGKGEVYEISRTEEVHEISRTEEVYTSSEFDVHSDFTEIKTQAEEFLHNVSKFDGHPDLTKIKRRSKKKDQHEDGAAAAASTAAGSSIPVSAPRSARKLAASLWELQKHPLATSAASIGSKAPPTRPVLLCRRLRHVQAKSSHLAAAMSLFVKGYRYTYTQ